MSAKNFMGAAILAAVAVAIFLMKAMQVGVMRAAIALVVAIAFTAVAFLGVVLITDDGR